ncbi:MAG: hypothetical protein ABIT47_02190 [Candidatus Paceibacterota bacterium]
MDIETTPSNPITPTTKKVETPWGVIIATLLILGIVVSGACYAFTERIAPTPTTDSSSV